MNLRPCNFLFAAFTAALAIARPWPAGADNTPSTAPRVEVIDARFRVIKPDGSILRGADLVGLILHLRNGQGEPIEIRIDSVTLPAGEPDAGVELYGLSHRVDGSMDWMPLCKAGADGRALGFPLPGATPTDEETPVSGGEFSIT